MGAEEKLAKIKQLFDGGCVKGSCLECKYRGKGMFVGCTDLYLIDAIEALVMEDENE